MAIGRPLELKASPQKAVTILEPALKLNIPHDYPNSFGLGVVKNCRAYHFTLMRPLKDANEHQMLKPIIKLVLTLLTFQVAVLPLSAAQLTLKDVKTITGAILSEEADHFVVAQDYGTATIQKAHVAAINRDAEARNQPKPTTTTASIFPNWQRIILRAANQPWVSNLNQIPATVIDAGVFKSVPYLSFSISGNYELNVYGDPDAPAAVEIGLYRGLLNDANLSFATEAGDLRKWLIFKAGS